MQSEKMQVQLGPQLTLIQSQLKTAIANHQMVFGSYQRDPENVVLRDKLAEMQVKIKNLSDHQKALVQQLKGQLIQSTCVASTGPTVTTYVTSATSPLIVTSSSMAAAVSRAMGPLSSQPQLLTLQPHANVGIVVPLAHMQAQPTLMTLPGVLNQPNLQSPQTQPLVSLHLNTSSATPAAAILTSPNPINTTSVSSPNSNKQSQVCAPPTGTAPKTSQSVLRPIQPRPASPPIKVPQYTINHHSSQGQQAASHKAAEKSNGVLHRSYSDSDAKDLKKNADHADKDSWKVKDEKNFEHKKKLDFMGCIGLVTHDASKVIQNKRVERKRRSTANPHYSYALDSVKRRNGGSANGASGNSSWLTGSSPAKRAKGRSKPNTSPGNSCPPSPDRHDVSRSEGTVMAEVMKSICTVCSKKGEVLVCAICATKYHLDCLSPPLASVPVAPWSCPACIITGKDTGKLTNGALKMVNSYIAAKANREDEGRRLHRINLELTETVENLQEKSKGLKEQIKEKKTRCEKLTDEINHNTATANTLDCFVKSFQDPPPPVSSS